MPSANMIDRPIPFRHSFIHSFKQSLFNRSVDRWIVKRFISQSARFVRAILFFFLFEMEWIFFVRKWPEWKRFYLLGLFQKQHQQKINIEKDGWLFCSNQDLWLKYEWLSKWFVVIFVLFWKFFCVFLIITCC